MLSGQHRTSLVLCSDTCHTTRNPQVPATGRQHKQGDETCRTLNDNLPHHRAKPNWPRGHKARHQNGAGCLATQNGADQASITHQLDSFLLNHVHEHGWLIITSVVGTEWLQSTWKVWSRTGLSLQIMHFTNTVVGLTRESFRQIHSKPYFFFSAKGNSTCPGSDVFLIIQTYRDWTKSKKVTKCRSELVKDQWLLQANNVLTIANSSGVITGGGGGGGGACACVCVHACVCMRVYVCVCVCVRACVRARAVYLHKCAHVYTLYFDCSICSRLPL